MKPTENPKTTGSYLGRILVDGATPFLYRSTVRALLGLPGGRTGNAAVKQHLPPVGLKYAHPQPGNEFDAGESAPHPLNPVLPATGAAGQLQTGIRNKTSEKQQETDISAHSVSLNSAAKKITEKPLQKNAVKPGPGSFEDDLVDSREGIKPVSNQPGKVYFEPPASEPHRKISGKPPGIKQESKPAEKIATQVAAEHHSPAINIPGFTSKQKRFPAVVTQNDEKTQPPEAPLPVQKSAGPVAAPKSYPKQQLPQVAKRKGDETKVSALLRHFPPASGTKRQRTSPPGKGMEKQKPSPFVYRRHQENNEILIQLQQKVDELAAKNVELSSQIRKHKTEVQKQNRKPSSPPEKSAVTAKPAKNTRMRNAFWERNYLSRFHLKMLR